MKHNYCIELIETGETYHGQLIEERVTDISDYYPIRHCDGDWTEACSIGPKGSNILVNWLGYFKPDSPIELILDKEVEIKGKYL